MNETLKAIQDRRSIRRFQAEPLTQTELDALADVALASPTGMNRQTWEFRFITDQALIAGLNAAAMETFREEGNQAIIDRMAARHESIFYGAPLVILISMPKGEDGGLDAGIAAANLAVAAQSMGLGSCIIGLAAAAFTGEKGERLARQVQWPDNHEFAISIAIGHPAITKEPHERHPEKIRFIGG